MKFPDVHRKEWVVINFQKTLFHYELNKMFTSSKKCHFLATFKTKFFTMN